MLVLSIAFSSGIYLTATAIGLSITLDKILELFKSHENLTVPVIASRFGTPPAMVEVMLEHLYHRGLLQVQKMVNCAQDSCGSCGLSGDCHSNTITQGRYFTLK